MIGNNAPEIWERTIQPRFETLSAEAARSILSIDFSGGDCARMNDLSEKARLGTLTSDEELELDGYVLFGHFLAFLQSKARAALKKTSTAA